MTKHYKIEFYAGVGFDKNQNAIHPATVLVAIDNIKSRATSLFDGVTILHGEGIWQQDGATVAEPSVIISAIVFALHDVEAFADFVKAELNQASVLVTVTELSNSFFV